jgi:hypothetical protein
MNIWDFNETDLIPEGGDAPVRDALTTEWTWFRLCSRTGNPFPGIEVDQYGPNPTPLNLTAGKHTFHIAHREHSFGDVIFGTMDAKEHPSTTGVAVQPIGKMTTTWAQIKQTK